MNKNSHLDYQRKGFVMRLAILSFLICLLAIPVFAGQPASREEIRSLEWEMKTKHWHAIRDQQSNPIILDQSDYDVKYWELTVNVTNIQGQRISGQVRMTSAATINGLTSIDYDMHSALTDDTVWVNGQPAVHTRGNNQIHITLDRAYNIGEQFTTYITYSGTPPGGGFGSFTWNTHNGQPIISTLSEPEGAREWWPCKDIPHDKADSSDVYIITPSNLTGTSNGTLVSNQDNGNGTRTFHWHISYPISTYLICLSVSNYQTIEQWYVGLEGDSMPVVHYVYPELYSDAVIDFSITPAAIGIFAGMFGEYPFINEKYGHSLFPWGGAMEHQCNTSYGSSLIQGNHYYDWILVHELGHQWFGDMITCDIWPDIWMNEGFASYLEALYTEHEDGFTAYTNYMRMTNGVTDPSGPIYDPDELFDGNTVYNKGSWVLHILRGVMGDSAFFQGMRAYANHPNHQYGTITTRQFQAIMEQYYGADLGWFFDEWVWGMNRPQYRYSWMKQDIGGGQYEVFLHLRQMQSSPAPNVFTMPIRVYPRINNVDTTITVWNNSRIADYRFVVNGNPTTLAFDKYYWILRDAQSETYTMNIVTTSLPNGSLDQTYNQTVESRGGILPYHFAVQTGQLPTGLTLDINTGVINGQPTAMGTYTFTIRCTDSSSPVKTDDQEYTVVITEVSGIEDGDTGVPTEFMLIGNYPNPFNSSTLIRLELPEPGNIKVEVFNMLGQRVETIFDGFMNAGESEIRWNAGSISSGIYFYKVTSGERTATRKMLLVK